MLSEVEEHHCLDRVCDVIERENKLYLRAIGPGEHTRVEEISAEEGRSRELLDGSDVALRDLLEELPSSNMDVNCLAKLLIQ